ncbi:hypothetical protein [Aridibaculum aurantiacum]|uniref:hypothetical protein n=1 Tax=Aridibaculum aurantiacum TaxID=2810307 RepID=UPI001A9629D7|nr:hypothetical protein [Aridibaculum aurantiacum]
MAVDVFANDNQNLQKTFLSENRRFLEAIRKKHPLEDILRQYDKVTKVFETIKQKHRTVGE